MPGFNNIPGSFVFGRGGSQEEELLDKIYQVLSGDLNTSGSTNTFNMQNIPPPFLYDTHYSRREQLLDKILQAALGFGGGGGATNPIIRNEAGDFTVEIAAGKMLEYIAVKETTTLNIGTTPGGTEIHEGELDAVVWNTIALYLHFAAATTLYFSNVALPGTSIKNYKIYTR